jgi:hypothetical protein
MILGMTFEEKDSDSICDFRANDGEEHGGTNHERRIFCIKHGDLSS